MTADTLISKVWGFCTTLRDDGVSYGDYRTVHRRQAGRRSSRRFLRSR